MVKALVHALDQDPVRCPFLVHELVNPPLAQVQLLVPPLACVLRALRPLVRVLRALRALVPALVLDPHGVKPTSLVRTKVLALVLLNNSQLRTGRDSNPDT